MSANPTHQIWTTSKVQRLPAELRRRVTFYAPLIHSLDYLGVGEATFTRAAAATATYRDGAAHTVAANIPRFEYSGENALGLPISSSETLSFPKGNRIGSGTLIWFEAAVPKVAPLNDLNPFRDGQWRGVLDTHVRDIVHVDGVLTDSEVNEIIKIIAGQGSFTPNGWILEEPTKLTATTCQLVRSPDASALLVSAGGTLLKRVASAPAMMQYTLAGDVLTFGTAFQGTPAVRALYRRSGVPGPTFKIEDVGRHQGRGQ